MSKFFIRRPIVAIVIAILMVIGGLVSMLTLPTAQFPNIVPPEILVQATYPGADAKTLEEAVATPIEQQMNGVDNMNYMESTNASNGLTQLTVDFGVGTNSDTDQILSQLRVSQAQSQLPAEVSVAGLTVLKSLSSPLMLLAVSSPNSTYDGTFLANYAYINLVDDITRVKGVARVQVFGAGQYALRVWVKPDQLAKLGVTIPQITAALQAQNTVNPAGQIGGEPVPNGQQFTYTVRTQGRLVSAKQFGDIILRSNPDGSVLHLRDVARIDLGAQTYNLAGRFNSKPGAIMAVYQLPGSNAVQTAKDVRARMDQLVPTFPPDMRYDVALDTTAAVNAGIHEILVTLLIALVLVILVVYIFLQGWRATLIPLLAVPVSLIGTFMVFPLLGFSINTLSLFGLVLAIGLVVDDAIVVVEAVEHHIEEGMTPLEASYAAMEQVASPVIAIALILTAVFVPTAFIPGITGRLYQQFAVTIAISVIFSAFNALTLSPALCAMLLKPKKESKGPLARFFRSFNRGFARVTNGYVSTSGWLVRKSIVGILIIAVLSVFVLLLGSKIPGGFLPTEDQGYAFVNLQLPQAASLQRTSQAATSVENALHQVPGVESVTSVVGFSLLSQTQSTYNAFFFVTLKNWDQRKSKDEQFAAVQANLAKALGGVKQGIAFSFPPPAIPGLGSSGGVSLVLEDRSGGSDPNFLTTNLYKFLGAASKRPEIAAAIPTYYPAVPQLYVDVDREKVAQQQVNLADVYTTMQAFMGGSLVNYFNRFGRQWQTYVEAEGDSRTNIDNIGQFYVTAANGNRVPLSALATVRRVTGPEFTTRFNEHEAAQITIVGAPGYSSGQVMAALEQTFAKTMPPGMGYDYQGMSYQEKKAQESIPAWVVYSLSILFCFLILAAQYESWSLPFGVLLSTPVAIFGAYLALTLRRLENDVYAQIGLVMLIGLSAKNAILIVEFAKDEYAKGETIFNAAMNGARLRFRPILMTAFAFILGCVPLWVATGAGGVSRQILGTVVIGGMLAATLIAIFLIPVTFSLAERVASRFGADHSGSLDAKGHPDDALPPPHSIAADHNDPSHGGNV
ncbi:MAG: multidrug efflux RND transporter permease subunit [Acidobacteria bacterium]|nr:multidrug efflux RND transporter permease subunit [Acidobacteriota bacterium]